MLIAEVTWSGTWNKTECKAVNTAKGWFNLGGAVIVFSFSVALALIAGDRRGNPNLQVVITHVSHVRSQYSFRLPLRNGMHRTHFDHARFDLLSLVIWSRVFLSLFFFVTFQTYAKHSAGAKAKALSPPTLFPLPYVMPVLHSVSF